MKKVTAVKPNNDFSLVVKFDDGKVKHFDVKPYLDSEVFEELKNWDLFKKVSIAFGSVRWENNQDFSSDTLYVEGKEISRAGVGDIEIINANAELINQQVEETLGYQAEW